MEVAEQIREALENGGGGGGKMGDPFDGSQDYLAWKRRIQGKLLFSKKSGEKKAEWVFSQLTGSAADFVLDGVDLNGDEAPFTSPRGIFDILDVMYGIPAANQKREAAIELKSLRQGSKTLLEYSTKVVSLTTAAALDDDSKVGMFIEGLNSRLRSPVMMGDPASLPAAIRMAQLADRALPKTEAKKDKDRGSKSKNWREKRPEKKERADKKPSKDSKPSKGRTADSSTECFECGKKGHFARDCKGKGKARKESRITEVDSDDEDSTSLAGYESGKD